MVNLQSGATNVEIIVQSPADLLRAYLANVREPAKAAALFADDGAVELPTMNARLVGPEKIEGLLRNFLAAVPDLAFQNVEIHIETADQAFGEYEVEAVVAATGRLYHQHYAGRLVAENGKIKLLREAMDTHAARVAFDMPSETAS